MTKVEIYTNKRSQSQIKVNFDGDTVWLNLNQISEVFDRDKSVISRHLNKIYKEKELEREATVAKNATVQIEGAREVSRDVEYFNLDAVLAVGYRVNSRQGTEFRKWATEVLSVHLSQGFTINQKRLNQLEKTITLLSNEESPKSLEEAKGLLHIIKNYSKSFALLSKFDSDDLKVENLNQNVIYQINPVEAQQMISELKLQLVHKNEASELFGIQKDDSFAGILGNILQSFDGQYLYKTIEEQAANLLYLTIKNHPFSDGNKRIGAFMFIWFLEKNKFSLKKNGELKINDNALTALALLIARSNPNEKDLMINLVINLINELY